MAKRYSSRSPKVIKEMSAIQDNQYYITVTKSNELIRKSCYNLSIVQQKLLCYFITDIKDTDTASTVKEYDLRDIYKFLCVHSNSREVVKNLSAIDKKTWWIVTDTESIRYRFFNELIVTHDNKVRLSFHSSILPYLQNLIADKCYTYYRLLYILCMKSEYSIRLYEMLKAAEHNGIWYYELDWLKKQLECENKYPKFADFRKRVIDAALHEINEQTDITVAYSMHRKQGSRLYDGIEFYIETKSKKDRLDAEKGIRDKLNGNIEKTHEKTMSEIKIP